MTPDLTYLLALWDKRAEPEGVRSNEAAAAWRAAAVELRKMLPKNANRVQPLDPAVTDEMVIGALDAFAEAGRVWYHPHTPAMMHAMRAALAATQPTWREINDAAKSGALVMLGREGSSDVLLACWHVQAWFGRSGAFVCTGDWPTAWQPLPPPPGVRP